MGLIFLVELFLHVLKLNASLWEEWKKIKKGEKLFG